MSNIELPGGCVPIPKETWAGPLIPEMTKALLVGDHEGASRAFAEWVATSGTTYETPTFPASDEAMLISTGRPRLAKLLIDKGLLSDNPTA